MDWVYQRPHTKRACHSRKAGQTEDRDTEGHMASTTGGWGLQAERFLGPREMWMAPAGGGMLGRGHSRARQDEPPSDQASEGCIMVDVDRRESY